MVVELQTYHKKKIKILPRNVHQEDYIDLLNDTQKSIVFATGPAGTGKTMLAVQMGIQKLDAGEIDRIVVTRPAVSVDEQHGFLPGDLNKKMEQIMVTRPITELLIPNNTYQNIELTAKTIDFNVFNRVTKPTIPEFTEE
jgi:phosphate starvation-inducible PhoH-like protein